MRVQPRRAMLIGIDSAVLPRWRRYAETGLLPVGRRLLDGGCLVTQCLPPMPTLTTTNWATIATGAWPGTHGIVDFNPRRPGDGFEDSVQGVDARDLRAETVWDAAARGGRRAVVVNYPGSWPPLHAGGDGEVVLLGGAGIELNEWRLGLPGKGHVVSLAAEQRFSSVAGEPLSTCVGAPVPGEPFECAFSYRDAYEPVETEFALVCRVSVGGARPTASFTVRGEEEPVAVLAAGEWSDVIRRPFRAGGDEVTGGFRLKLLELEPGPTGRFRLLVTDLARFGWLEDPPGALGDTSAFAGFPGPGVGWDSLMRGCIGLETFVELSTMATEWLADACVQTLQRHEWDLFCVHFHAVDSFYHLLSPKLDPAQTPDGAERARYEAGELTLYRNIDAAIGRILETADEPAFTALVSDHGEKPATRMVPLPAILEEAGLLARRDDGAVDYGRSLAAPHGACYVSLNLQGREPEGCVAPADADALRERVIAALQDYRDRETGLCPFSLVLRREDARILGLYGEGVGDVVYAVREEFSDDHGQVLGTGEAAGGSLRSLLLFAGAGARHGAVIERPASLTDVVPTLCHAAGLPLPRQAEGAVLHQALDAGG
jgi:hypothetical protein